MQPVKSSFLFIGTWPETLDSLAPTRVKNLEMALTALKKQSYPVIGLHMTSALESLFDDFYQEIQKTSPWTTMVLCYPQGFPPKKLLHLHSHFRFFRILQKIDPTKIEATFIEAFEKASLLHQDAQIEEMIRQQEIELDQFQKELERRSSERTSNLAEKRFSLHSQTLQLESLRECLLAIQGSSSIAELEQALNQTLSKTAQTLWVRIIQKPLDQTFAKQTEQMNSFHIHEKTLFKGQKEIGSIFFLKSKDLPFQKSELRLFAKITDAIALSVDRLLAAKNSEELQNQWSATFASIEDSTAIIDQNYNIIQSGDPAAASMKCYTWKFGRSSPCSFCQRGSNFRVREDSFGNTFEVYSQKIQISPLEQTVYFNMYHDITSEVQVEEAIFATAQKSEIGLISSSIAHELNNPLSGILTYSQLLNMELPKDHPIKQDIELIEAGAKRSQEIIKNLLSFSRSNENKSDHHSSALATVAKSINLFSVKGKHLGIEATLNASDEFDFEVAQPNLFGQLVLQILSIGLHSKGPGKIELDLRRTDKSFELVFCFPQLENENKKTEIELTISSVSPLLGELKMTLSHSLISSPESPAKISIYRPVLV